MSSPIRPELPWQPATDYERELEEAFAAGDTASCYGLLMPANVVVPTTREAHEGQAQHQWPTYTDDERTFVLAYTSFEAMRLATSGNLEYGMIMRLDELAATWPDPAYGLAINAGLRVAFYFESGMVARLAAPSLEILDLPGERFSLAMQKVLTREDAEQYVVQRGMSVSGYCQFYWHVEHISSPRVLVETLGLPPERYLTEGDTTFVLRWRPIALSLYADAYGGETEQARDLVGGSIVEEPPFRGLGFGPNPTQVIREFKANCAPLPTGAEIWQLDDSGERRLAILDALEGGWRLVARTDEIVPLDDARQSDAEGGL